MINIENIVDESGILLAKDAIEAGIPKHILYRYIKEKKSEKTKSESSDDSSEDAEENNKTITANNTQTKNTDKKKNRG